MIAHAANASASMGRGERRRGPRAAGSTESAVAGDESSAAGTRSMRTVAALAAAAENDGMYGSGAGLSAKRTSPWSCALPGIASISGSSTVIRGSLEGARGASEEGSRGSDPPDERT